MSTVLATRALCPPGQPRPGWVALDGDRVADVGWGEAPRGAVDLGDALLTPGFVDLQCNGVDHDDLAHADAAGWHRVAATLAHHGTTAYCATFVSAPLDSYDAPLALAAAERSTPAAGGAALLGVHLEGPFLGGAPGAHSPGEIRPVDVEWLDALLRARPGLVRIVTLAPEADPELVAVEHLAAAGVVVALGHTRATYDDTIAAVDAGARVATHLFNGMAPLHHREPGIVGAALDDDRLTPTVIADGVHVHPVALRLAFARRSDVAVVSDAVALGDGVVGRNRAAYLEDGTLAGATTLLDGALRTLVHAGIAVDRAVEAATVVPASVLGLTDRGRISRGARADLVALDPTTFVPRAVWIDGRRLAIPGDSSGDR